MRVYFPAGSATNRPSSLMRWQVFLTLLVPRLIASGDGGWSGAWVVSEVPEDGGPGVGGGQLFDVAVE